MALMCAIFLLDTNLWYAPREVMLEAITQHADYIYRARALRARLLITALPMRLKLLDMESCKTYLVKRLSTHQARFVSPAGLIFVYSCQLTVLEAEAGSYQS